MSKIDQMAHLVLANPNITAKELAGKLGYAEPKSIYYWLEKAGFKGMRDFKKTVLSRSFPIPKEQPTAARDSERLPPMPLYTDNDRLRRLSLDEHLRCQLGPRTFAILVSENEFGQIAQSGDILIIDPDEAYSQGDLLLANLDESSYIVRVYYLPDRSPIYVDVRNRSQLLSPDFINGKVAFVIKRSV